MSNQLWLWSSLIFISSDARSLLIKSIVNHYKQCGALKDVILPDISIGGHIYGHAVQQQLFLALADHLRYGGNYCGKQMVLAARNSLGGSDQVILKPDCSATETS